MTEIIIIGAGIAGCTSGHLLADRGYDVTILEKDAIGGLLREIEFEGGWYCDSAPHLLFFEESDPLEAKVEPLFSQFSTLTYRDYYAATYPNGSLADPHHYPASIANIDKWSDADRIRDEMASARRSSVSDPASFADYMVNLVGETFYERYFKGYTEKHWGIDPARITGDWFDFKITIPETEREFFGDGAYYPEERYSAILREMVAECDVIHDGAVELVTDGNHIEAVRTESGEALAADHVVSTIDPSILVTDVDEPLTYRSMIILGMHVELDQRLFPDHVDWGYFPNHYDFTRITDYGFTGQSLPEDEYLLTVEFPCFTHEPVWSRSVSWFEQYIEDFFREQSIEGRILDSVVRRAPRAYPLPVTEEIERFNRISDRLNRFDNISNLGRVSTYEYIWIKDIVGQAYSMVEELTNSFDG